MIFLYLNERMATGNAIALTLGIIIFLIAFISIIWWGLCEYSSKIRVLTWKIAALFAGLDFMDHDDDPNMPAEYASWASAEKWRQTCIRPEDRRM